MPKTKSKVSPKKVKRKSVSMPGDQDSLNSILANAMKHPGVADVVKAYEVSADIDTAYGAYQYFNTPHYETIAAATSAMGNSLTIR